ncbi:hypothetical protein PAXRUDRAFT_13737 [Paxillus rubicundulus Ve08.2h10]|uniref:Uncharacterized protein n=1 Tax=Paxillus rubicundulus Ve08.2h10 TaxID=930991 RepID=A0A0D0DK54_9AGAM|nr:hypothetical protein PAXRUDRAFT_13737 [Paxillus rubicundulus Ve08.2h10]
MDKISSVIAALDAGKLPTQAQINAIIDWTLENLVVFPDSPDIEKLSEPGKILVRGLREVLVAYKQLGTSKNYDNLLQGALWHLSEGDYSKTWVEAIDRDEVTADLQAFRSAVRTLLKILWQNLSGEGSQILGDFASFTRLAMADLAEVIESQAGYAKQSLRVLESEVQQGERDPLGRRRKTQEEDEGNVKVKFEKTMDTVKEAGSKAIGAGQSFKVSAEETAERTSARLLEAYYKVCDRAQSDEEYRRALSTLFDTASKWMDRTLDTAADVDQVTSLDTFIDDPTEEKPLYHALYDLRTLVERLAGGKSLGDLFNKVRICAADAKQDEDLKAWFDDFFAHVRKSLETPGYARTEDAQGKHKELGRRWNDLLEEETDAARKWKEDVHRFHCEFREFYQAIARDPDLQSVTRAHATFAEDMEKSMVAGRQLAMHSLFDQASWLWQDVFNVHAHRLLAVVKSIPIPRTEYVDPEVEFVLENLDVSSLNLLPGHVFIRNITDVDITAPGEPGASTSTAFGTLTHIRLQAIQLTLKEVSFFYKDKSATVGPSEFTGIMQFNLPTQGLDVDFKFRLIPNTSQGLAERERLGRFFKVERVDVKLAENVTFEVKASNHAILATLFKPILILRFREAVERTLEEQITGLFNFADAIAYDVRRRSEVFQDTGFGPGPSTAAAMWSELGRLRKMEGGLLSGWKATGTGIVKGGFAHDATIAMGAEPQILSGEKRGPLGVHAEPLSKRGLDIGGVLEEGRFVAQRVKENSQEGLKQVQTFKQSVQHKASVEKNRPGWESSAYDIV